jgi:tyrosine-protein phosphatase YwqE
LAEIQKIRKIGKLQKTLIGGIAPTLGMSSQMLFKFPFFSVQNLVAVIVSELVFRSVEPLIIPMRKLKTERYTLLYGK